MKKMENNEKNERHENNEKILKIIHNKWKNIKNIPKDRKIYFSVFSSFSDFSEFLYFFPQHIVEGLLNSRRRVSDRPSWILISRSPAKKPTNIVVVFFVSRLAWMTETFSGPERSSYSRCEALDSARFFFSRSTILGGSQGRFIQSNGEKPSFCMNHYPIAAVKLSLSASTAKCHFLSI